MRVSDAGAEERAEGTEIRSTPSNHHQTGDYRARSGPSVCVSLEHELQNGLLKPETAQNSGA